MYRQDTTVNNGLKSIAKMYEGKRQYELSNHLGNVLTVISDRRTYTISGTTKIYDAVVLSAQDYYPFGMGIDARSFSSTTSYRYSFNGKESDKEIGTQDYGNRGYDPLRGQWWSIDKFKSKYPSISPYSFAANNPISIVDVKGDSLYILFHTTGNTHNDEMFKAMAFTRHNAIVRSPTFDPKRDKVVILGVQDVYQIKEMVETTTKENQAVYGKTVEVDIWSHAGPGNGPVGTIQTSQHAVDKQQMDDKGWALINFNWAPNARISFYGCRTGIILNGDNGDVAKGRASFATEMSALPNFKDVTVYGLTGSGFASIYTNYRENLSRKNSDFVPGTTPSGNPIFTTTYMIGGMRLSKKVTNPFHWNIPLTLAYPMSASKNGTGKVVGYQDGNKKPTSQ
jgi:RHS repeat-associated protein